MTEEEKCARSAALEAISQPSSYEELLQAILDGRVIASMPRRSGKTTAVVAAARRLSTPVVVPTRQMKSHFGQLNKDIVFLTPDELPRYMMGRADRRVLIDEVDDRLIASTYPFINIIGGAAARRPDYNEEEVCQTFRIPSYHRKPTK